MAEKQALGRVSASLTPRVGASYGALDAIRRFGQPARPRPGR